jgi:hypothetical protein
MAVNVSKSKCKTESLNSILVRYRSSNNYFFYQRTRCSLLQVFKLNSYTNTVLIILLKMLQKLGCLTLKTVSHYCARHSKGSTMIEDIQFEVIVYVSHNFTKKLAERDNNPVTHLHTKGFTGICLVL